MILQTKHLVKEYGTGDTRFYALNDVNLQIGAGEFVVIMGQSGSGKSTLLNMLSGLDRPTSGEIILDGIHLNRLNDAERTLVRREKIGFIFQFFNLIPVLNVLENVTLPLRLGGEKNKKWERRAKELLAIVGLSDKLTSRPAELSGGQQQRVAIARALLSRPALIMADEPTGSLDSKTSKDVLELLKSCCSQFNQTIVLVTHDAQVASFAERVLFMKDGRLADELFIHPDESLRSQQIAEIYRRIEMIA
ncbi:ABC transporter ATP-binding protein [Paenactinomyces guangxiensis]|uniref:ABC transporter ATP-binding protein n=1 Tax=Paenactinomyces guangxiensis TaxID=1490290 RepID=A0A7W1WU85_9BACL|nr:ABC transporter ATP-binding protein [Paenactinomyces guangxiensis]MBA4496124.1 ABC transporter ATP-binding protein [Paenactinomyces guangxiensis]MBH8593212.1 ABC transporter ATP-binding protein [Paenactinomyces guangxiensis]